jgi:hypothetical protein
MYPRDERGKKVELTREQKSEMLYIYQTKLAEWMGVTIT